MKYNDLTIYNYLDYIIINHDYIFFKYWTWRKAKMGQGEGCLDRTHKWKICYKKAEKYTIDLRTQLLWWIHVSTNGIYPLTLHRWTTTWDGGTYPNGYSTGSYNTWTQTKDCMLNICSYGWSTQTLHTLHFQTAWKKSHKYMGKQIKIKSNTHPARKISRSNCSSFHPLSHYL